jgi:bifunctional non-homologous end joining protein LigD
LLPEEKKITKSRTAAKSVRYGSSKLTDYITPMLAKLHDEPFDNPDWVFEIKWDGYRAVAEVNKKNIRLYSRNGLSFKEAYPPVFEELKKIKKDVVIDGEIVALDDKGMPRFQLIQQYAQTHDVPICYYVFDCLYVNGKSIEDKPLTERKEILKKLLPASDIIVYCDHVEQQGKKFFKAASRQGLEGIIAKRADSTYSEGVRTSEWLKIKHVITDEAVIAGYTQARNSRKYFGALVLGMYKDGKFIYIGHTGTGFNDASLKEVYNLLQPLKTDKSPFDTKVPANMPVTWVKPKLVCALKYTEVTEGGQRRHPVFLGLRPDKAAKEVTGEVKA